MNYQDIPEVNDMDMLYSTVTTNQTLLNQAMENGFW